MTMYVIENEDGCVLDRTYYEFTNDVDRALLFDEPIAPAEYAKRYGGHVVPLVEKTERAKLELTTGQEQDLADLKMKFLCEIDQFAHNSGISLGSNVFELFANGYDVVHKPTKWYVKVPGKFDRPTYYATLSGELALGWFDKHTVRDFDPHEFTAAEIESYGLQGCEKVEVHDE